MVLVVRSSKPVVVLGFICGFGGQMLETTSKTMNNHQNNGVFGFLALNSNFVVFYSKPLCKDKP